MNEAIVALGVNTSQALALLALIGVGAGLLRWRNATRRDFLLAFLIFLFGTALREVPVYFAGMSAWSINWVLLSGISRVVQLIGVVLFVRASLRDHCGPWGWKAVVFGVLILTAVIP